MVELKTSPAEVMPFVDEVIQEADGERESLGFLREGVYWELAAQGKLIVATIGQRYVGHLLFGGVAPHARVFQTHVRKSFRRRGVGQRLVQKLVQNAETWNYISITARVASDLVANEFYERMGFRHVRTAPGGATRNRVINVRVKELNTPNLFNATGPVVAADLGLIEGLPTRAPRYVVDLNVVFDILRRRVNAEDAGRIIRAGFNNLLRLAVTNEFIEELRRNSQDVDPVLEFALRLPILPQEAPEEISNLIDVLERKIFPQRVLENRLSVRDRSDTIHLATAIFHKAAGFITGEKAILRAREFLTREYGLDIVAVGEMAILDDSEANRDIPAVSSIAEDVEIVCRTPISGDRGKLSALFERLGVAAANINELLTGSSVGQIVILADGSPIAFASWVNDTHESIRAFACADEDNPLMETSLDRALDHICRAACRKNPALVRLRLIAGHAKTSTVAFLHGFRPAADHFQSKYVLHKVCVGKCVTNETWSSIRHSIMRAAGVILPESMPISTADMIEIMTPSGSQKLVSLEDLETLLSPVLLLLPGRAGSIVPIQSRFVSDLLGNSPQLRLLHSAEARFLRERVYFSDPKTSSLLQRGKPILFYESGRGGGRSSIIAIARVVRSDLVSKKGVLTELLKRGVLTEQTLQRMGRSELSAATVFDNILHFRNPISLRRMQELGFHDPANLITTKSVSFGILSSIVNTGNIGV
jgi:GNAT superfamily N-acetyltransferase/predicted nucleic acid-binding protein